MLGGINIHDILFLDIETVPLTSSFGEMDDTLQRLWTKKSAFFRKEGEEAAAVYQRAGIYAEFGKIVCISVGVVTLSGSGLGLRLTSYAGDDEVKLLRDFSGMMEGYAKTRNLLLCAHNGKEFDFPFIARRMLIHHIPLPNTLDVAGKKPWEVPFLDTLELWKFGDYKHYTSLELLTHIFGIPSPKNDIDGSQVAGVYYEDRDIARIISYCQNDVVAVVQLFLRYRTMDLIPEERIERVPPKV